MSTIQFVCDGSFFNISMPPHGRAHEWINGERRDDAVSFHPRMFAYLRTTTIEDTVRINITPLVYRVGSAFRTFTGIKVNLTDYIPLTTNFSKLVLVGLNTTTNEIEIIEGSEALDTAESPLVIPTGMADNFIPSALVKLKYGDLALTEDRITDARIFLTANSSEPSTISSLAASDGSPDPAWAVDNDGNLTNPGGGVIEQDVMRVSQLVSPDGLIDPAWIVDNSGNLFNDAGGKLDFNGTPDAIILDTDGDTSIGAPTDDKLDLTANGSIVVEVSPGGVELPNGGDISIVGSGDIFITDNEVGLFRRANFFRTKDNVEDEFDGSSLDAAWSWDSVFGVTPANVSFSVASHLILGHNAINQRMFLYRTDNLGSTNHAIVLSANGFTIDGMYAGWRFDNGTDNNYVEGVIRKTTGSATLELVSRTRTGGGAVTQTVWQTIYDFPSVWVLGSQPQGTQWSNWSNTIYFGFPHNPTTSAFYPTIAGLTWTPTRRGIIFFNSNTTQTFRGPYIDRVLRF